MSSFINFLYNQAAQLSNLYRNETEQNSATSAMAERIHATRNSHPKPISAKVAKPKKSPNIAVLSNGGGYTVPRAIQSIESQTKKKVQLINYECPMEISSRQLNNEVKNVFNYIEKNKLCSPGVSRAEMFINAVKSKAVNTPLCFEIIQKTSRAAEKLNCIFLPGGENIPTIWYGMPGCEYDNHYRTLVELTLIHEARHKGIPLMGVCRGHQIIHVYHGKKLEDNPSGYYGFQTFNLINPDQKGLLADLFRETVVGRVMHHQGIKIAEGQNGKGDLEPLTTENELVKAAESKYGSASPVITTQFHPEMYVPYDSSISKNNETFFKILHESSITHNAKKDITPDKLVAARKQLKAPSEELKLFMQAGG